MNGVWGTDGEVAAEADALYWDLAAVIRRGRMSRSPRPFA
jgi:hypothetical protein